MKRYQRLRGLSHLVMDAALHGGRAVRQIQLETGKRVFDLVESVPVLGPPTTLVRVAHDLSIKGVHGTIEVVNRSLRAALDIAIDVAEASMQEAAEGPGATKPGPDGEPEVRRDPPTPPDSAEGFQARDVPSRP